MEQQHKTDSNFCNRTEWQNYKIRASQMDIICYCHSFLGRLDIICNRMKNNFMVKITLLPGFLIWIIRPKHIKNNPGFWNSIIVARLEVQFNNGLNLNRLQ